MSKRELRVSISFSVPVPLDAFEQARVVGGFSEAVRNLRTSVEIGEGSFQSDARIVTPKSSADDEPQLPLVGSVPPPVAIEVHSPKGGPPPTVIVVREGNSERKPQGEALAEVRGALTGEAPKSEDDLLEIPGFLRRENAVVIEGSNQAAP